MRPQGFGQVGAGLEDLGWNDMGFDPPKPAHSPDPDAEHDAFGEVIPAHPHNLAGLTPVDSPVHGQQAEIAGRLSAYSPADSDEDEEFDETAELYNPDAEEDEGDEQELEAALEEPAEAAPEPVLEAEPVVAPAPAPVFKPAPAPVSRRARKPRAAPGTKGKAAFTLRLDPERHLKLRLACAVDGRSAQMLVTQALDDLLAAMPELESMAVKAKRKG
jgi:hypothetical protein